MLEHFVKPMLPEIVSILKIIGIVMIAVGSLKASYHYIKVLFTHKHYPIRIELANALVLGLEFRMGAEMLRTVLVRSLSEAYILGAIVLLRILLSLIIHFEIKAEKEHGPASKVLPNNC